MLCTKGMMLGERRSSLFLHLWNRRRRADPDEVLKHAAAVGERSDLDNSGAY
ncbi:hypothetical protein ACIBL3_39565 [Kribbella sp. NPDC050124]|uniref:hypothetical protein n=1 Tax=Kribbella sp. NPDC050124 TaxID=3364114 RepID=UPI00378DDE1B